jgi:hypothetical protein
MKTRSSLKAGVLNHAQTLKVRSGVRGGLAAVNHSQVLKVKSGLKGGAMNHAQTLKVKTGVNAGGNCWK